MQKAIIASESQMITVAMKRVNMLNEATDDMLTHINREKVQLLPNTSGVRDAKEAVLAAQMSREIFHTDFIKLEIHPDPKYLMPDPIETLKATEELARLGFVGASLHSGRPRAVQASRRGGISRRDAACRPHRHKQKAS